LTLFFFGGFNFLFFRPAKFACVKVVAVTVAESNFSFVRNFVTGFCGLTAGAVVGKNAFVFAATVAVKVGTTPFSRSKLFPYILSKPPYDAP
jgi:hypothetical protein